MWQIQLKYVTVWSYHLRENTKRACVNFGFFCLATENRILKIFFHLHWHLQMAYSYVMNLSLARLIQAVAIHSAIDQFVLIHFGCKKIIERKNKKTFWKQFCIAKIKEIQVRFKLLLLFVLLSKFSFTFSSSCASSTLFPPILFFHRFPIFFRNVN